MPSRGVRPAFAAAALFATSPARALDPAKVPSQYVVHTWQEAEHAGEGLPQNYVASVVQTRDGYIWLATQEGVARFDGVRFVLFSSRDIPAIRTNNVTCLLEDRTGGLWIGTAAGLTRYANGTFTAYTTREGLAYDVVTTLYEAADGSLYVGTRGGGVSKRVNGAFTTYRAADGLGGDVVWAIDQAPDGAMWFGTDGGLSRLAGGTFTTVREGLSDPTVRALFVDPDGTVWAGSLGGLDRLAGGVVTPLGKTDGFDGGVRALLRDRDGNLWLGGSSGVFRLSTRPGATGKATPLGVLAPLRGQANHKLEGRAFLEDREGNLWIGVDSVGLVRVQDGKVTTFGSGLIWTTFEDSSRTLRFGGEDGIFTLTGDALVPAANDGAPLGEGVETMAQGPDGSLWLGTTANGLLMYAGGRAMAVPELAGMEVRSVYTDRRGTLWFGTNNGLGRMEGGKPRRFHAAEGAPEVAVNAFAEAADGALWIGTEGGGLLSMKDDVFSSPKEGLSNAAVASLYANGDDLWIGTWGGGLNLLRNGRIGRVTTKNGLFNDIVYSIVDDGHGELWMTCNQGIFHAKRSELEDVALGKQRTVSSPSLGRADGMKSSECNDGIPGAIRAHDGLLWFPTTDGAARVDPAHLRKNEVTPPVRIEEIDVNRVSIDLDRGRTLAPDSRDFQFVYTALSFSAPERVRFQYQLEGFDKDWVDAGTRRVAYYTNLSPGTYRFRVIAANEDGLWNRDGAAMELVLKPHFYQTFAFYFACALAFGFVGAGTVLLRLRGIRETAARLETKVAQRTAQLDDAKRGLEDALARRQEDLLQAEAFQRRMLPPLPKDGALRFRAFYKPADLVGGDLYDICEPRPGHFRLFLADTTGHGVQASLRTMVLKTEYDRVKLMHPTPAGVLEELNRALASTYTNLEMRCPACCFDVIVERGGALLRYANAASPPILRTSRGKVDELYLRSTFLGVIEDVEFRETEERIYPGDLLLAYTDGIYEQENEHGEPFGLERMVHILGGGRRHDAEGAVQVLDAAVMTFAQGRELDDDMLLVAVECVARRSG
jgi:ligand-binding sensor domain-containing protein/serine phosphatase RsbU (regulator of sigma subunit)